MAKPFAPPAVVPAGLVRSAWPARSSVIASRLEANTTGTVREPVISAVISLDQKQPTEPSRPDCTGLQNRASNVFVITRLSELAGVFQGLGLQGRGGFLAAMTVPLAAPAQASSDRSVKRHRRQTAGPHPRRTEPRLGHSTMASEGTSPSISPDQIPGACELLPPSRERPATTPRRLVLLRLALHT